YLFSYGNSLKRLDCSNLEKLKELNCSRNLLSFGEYGETFLEGLNVKNCNNLEILDCAENYLQELDISNLPKLSFISGKENFFIKDIEIVNCPVLEYLDISLRRTNMSEIPSVNYDENNPRKF